MTEMIQHTGFEKYKLCKSDLVFIRQADTQPNTIWTSDRIDLFVDGNIAGSIISAFIKSVKFSDYEASFLTFIRDFLGRKHYRHDIPLRESIIENYCQHNYIKRNSVVPQREYDLLVSFFDNFGPKFARHIDFWADKPLVDSVRTFHDKFDYWSLRRNGESPLIEKSFRGLGLGRMLYEQMAIWQAEKGYNLYASDTQSIEAKAMWERLAKYHPNAVIQTQGMLKIPVLGNRRRNPPVLNFREEESDKVRLHLNGTGLEMSSCPGVRSICVRGSEKSVDFAPG